MIQVTFASFNKSLFPESLLTLTRVTKCPLLPMPKCSPGASGSVLQKMWKNEEALLTYFKYIKLIRHLWVNFDYYLLISRLSGVSSFFGTQNMIALTLTLFLHENHINLNRSVFWATVSTSLHIFFMEESSLKIEKQKTYSCFPIYGHTES